MQKRILCIQDLSCVGRCSLAAVLPVLCACGHMACCLPTALLSTHTGGFGTPARAGQTAFCTEALAHYARLGLAFDGVYSGYLADDGQAAIVRGAFAQNPGAFKLVDPVLGDGGKAYRFVTPALVEAMRALCAEADLITPNWTESALLLGLAPDGGPLTEDNPLPGDAFVSEAEAQDRALALAKAFGADVVLTGAALPGGRRANVCARGGAARVLPYLPAPGQWPGTGDLFAAALLGRLLLDDGPENAVRTAAAFVRAAVQSAAAAGAPARFGVPFEPHLPALAKGDDPLWHSL